MGREDPEAAGTDESSSMTGEYVRTREVDGITQYEPACHYCGYHGPWTMIRDGAEVNANLHKYAHSDEGRLW